MPDCRPVRELLTHIIGGGWGSESADDVNEQQVAIIRGADFPQVQVGDATSLPIRFESSKRVGNRRLQDGDIVLEISGGTNERPTGRSVFVSQSILSQVPVPVIPASFCRLLRPDPLVVEPRYLYYWLQDMFSQGRTWAYQVRSTGIANFQTEYFLDQEIVTLPPLAEQRRIAGVLGALDDLIDVNRGLMRDLDALGMALFQSAWDGESWSPISSLGSVIMGQSPPGSTYNENGIGTVFFQGVRDFGDRYPRSRVHCTAPTRVADQGDILIAVRAPIGETNVAVERTAIGRGLAALKAQQPALSLRAVRASERTWAAHQGTGTVFSSISGPDLRNAVVPSVDDPALEAQLATLDVMHLALAQEIDELSSARDELLPLLMSGRVRVLEVVAA